MIVIRAGLGQLLFLNPMGKLAFYAFCDYDKNNLPTVYKPERKQTWGMESNNLGVHLVRKALVKAKNLSL